MNLASKVNALVDTPELHDFMEGLAMLGDVAIFGGAIRDLIMHGELRGDLDLIVDCNKKDLNRYVENMLEAGDFDEQVSNCLSGMRIKNLNVDVWSLHAMFNTASGVGSPHRFEDVPATAFLNWNAIVFDFAKQKFHKAEWYDVEIDGRALRINNPNQKNTFETNVKRLNRFIDLARTTDKNVAKWLTSSILEEVEFEL